MRSASSSLLLQAFVAIFFISSALAAPVITGLSVPSGVIGSSVTINGTGFGTSGTVKFTNNVQATTTVWTSTAITATVPGGAATGPVTVTVSGVTSNGVNFTVLPNIVGVAPLTGAVGASITVSGTAFGTTTGTIKFNTVSATPTTWGNSSIVVPVPSGVATGSAPIVVTTSAGLSSNAASFTVVLPPSITSLSPPSGKVGDPVTINGMNFSANLPKVYFNGTQATVISNLGTVIHTSVPAGATTGNVIVHASGVDSNGVLFTITNPAASSPNRWCAPVAGSFVGTVTGLAADGPAQPIQQCLYTELSNTPSLGVTHALTGGCSSFPCANDIVTAYNSAACGDTITLDPAATWDYSAHALTLASKSCDDSHWITIRSASAGSLPDEHTRISPCYANVASLPGRPSYSCPVGGAAQYLAKIIPAAGSNNALLAADHIRWIGIEWARATGTAQITQYIDMTGGHDMIFDRNWFHGTAYDESRHGIQLQTSYKVAILNSYFSDFHCFSGGACNQATAISAGLGTATPTTCIRTGTTVPRIAGCPGTYKLQNNFVEASGENFISGGGGANFVPVDFEVRGNHFFKPLYWNPNCATDNGCGAPGAYIGGTSVNLTDIQRTANSVTAHFATLPSSARVDTGTVGGAVLKIAGVSDTTLNVTLVGKITGSGPYTFTAAQICAPNPPGTCPNTSLISSSGTVIGPAFSVQNDFEMKNGAGLLLEDNILENSWGGFSQDGYALLLTPKNQGNASHTGGCPQCYDSDFTVRWNVITGSADGIQVAAVVDDFGNNAIGMERVSIHDIPIDGGFSDAASTGYGLELTFVCGQFLNDVTFDHMSWVKVPHSWLLIGTSTGTCSPVPTFQRITFTNSIVDAGTLPAGVTNGATGCQNGVAKPHDPKPLLDACAVPYTWTDNAVSDFVNTFTWPTLLNGFTGTAGIYTNYNSGYGGDYHTTNAVCSGGTMCLKNAGTDGKDIGADISLVATETSWAQ